MAGEPRECGPPWLTLAGSHDRGSSLDPRRMFANPGHVSRRQSVQGARCMCRRVCVSVCVSGARSMAVRGCVRVSHQQADGLSAGERHLHTCVVLP